MILSKFFNKKSNDIPLENAISFMIKQKELNEKNIKTLKSMNFSTDKLKEWDNLYNYIIEKLKLMRK